MTKNYLLKCIRLLLVGASLASALTYSMGRLRELPVGQSGYVGVWFLWAENLQLLCLDANAQVLSEPTSSAMARVEHRPEGYWVGLPVNAVIELEDEGTQPKRQCLKVEGLL